MREITTGLYTVFNEKVGSYHNDFFVSVNGQLYDTLAPDGAVMPFAVYLIITATDDDTFTENMMQVYLQFSLFSDASSSGEIKDMDSALTAMLKDKVFPVTGWTVETTRRLHSNGPYVVPADVASGTGRHWQMNVDFMAIVNKS